MMSNKRMTRKHTAVLSRGGIRFMYRALALSATAALLTFILSGCMVTDQTDATLDDARDAVQEAQDAIDGAAGDVQDALNGVGDTLSGIANAPQALLDMFDSADALFTKMASAAVYDAKTGEEIAVVDDRQAIENVVSKVNLVKLVSSHPDSSTAEYQITFSQNETIKLGQSADELKQVEAVTFTTYTDSNIVTIYIPAVHDSINTFDFEVSQEFADALRGLAG